MQKTKKTSEIIKNRASRGPASILVWIARLFAWGAVLAAATVAAAGFGLYFYISRDLPKISSLKDYRPPVITNVYSDDDRKIADFYRERRIIAPLSEMPPMLTQAFISAEDSRFYQHPGIDFLGIVRAFYKNLEAGTIVQGGSTITQQVTKSFFLTSERSYTRKIKEAILAYRIDKTFTKEEILFLYLNQIYLGHGAYGIQAAAESYFAKSVSDLNLAECALLAGLPQAPSKYSPFQHADRAKERQIYVLNRMVAEGYITNIQATEALNTRLDFKSRRNGNADAASYYTEHVRRYVESKYGTEALLTEGFQIYTAANIEMQHIALEEIEKGLRALDKRQGYRGPIKHIRPEEMETELASYLQDPEYGPLEEGRIVKGVVAQVDGVRGAVSVRLGGAEGTLRIADMRWARHSNPEIPIKPVRADRPAEVLTAGDVILVGLKARVKNSHLWELSLEQTPQVQGALLCIEAQTGQVKAMIGGRDFRESQFNRAIQARRQPGSAFKPIIYAAAIDKGYTPATMLIDSPVVYENEKSKVAWKPKNYEAKFYGPTLLRDALAKSRNVITIKILRGIGVDYAIDYAKRLGIDSELYRDLSLALGSSGVSLLELVRAYTVFNNQGDLVEPVFIRRILDRSGNVLEENAPHRQKVIDQSTAYVMTSLLEGVVKNGTGRSVAVLNRPVAAKTGTTNDLFDAWFIGYTPRYTTGVWVGFDQEASLGERETGSRAASPVWLGFMQRSLADKPIEVFSVPEGVVFTKIDAETGLLPIAESKKTLFECFKAGSEPTAYTKKPDSVTEPEEFFKADM